MEQDIYLEEMILLTIRKKWLVSLILVAAIAVLFNTILFSSMIDKYFINYLSETYETHITEISEYVSKALVTQKITKHQMQVELKTHLDDPIIGIEIYDNEKYKILEVRETETRGHRMMDNRIKQTDRYTITYKNTEIGEMHIIRNSSIEESLVAMKFKVSLLKYSLITLLVAIIIAFIVGTIVSLRASKELIETAKQAQDIDLGRDTKHKQSKIKEIQIIRQSLYKLETNIKLKQKTRKQLLDEMRHQINTPITILKTHLEGIQDGVINWNTEEYKLYEEQLNNIRDISIHLSNLIETSSTEEQLQIETFDISQVAEQLIKSIKPQFQNKNIELETKYPQKLEVKLDQYKIKQIIYNILTNAYKYTAENEKVKFEIKENQTNIEIIITDQGIGIKESEKKEIFEAYYRSNRHPEIKGKGLGLFIASQYAKQMQGQIQIKDNTPKGSQFIVILKNELENHRTTGS